MSKLHVVGNENGTLATCHGFSETENGVVIKDQSGEKAGFFPFGSFERVVRAETRTNGSNSKARRRILMRFVVRCVSP
ncbi:hypothetical protein [Haladaptatus sp. NG-SE-30]